MYKRLLIPTDGSELAGKAVKDGLAFAKSIGASTVLLTVTAPFHIFTLDPQAVEDTPAQYKRRMRDHATKLLDTGAAAASKARVRCETVHAEHEYPYRAIALPAWIAENTTPLASSAIIALKPRIWSP